MIGRPGPLQEAARSPWTSVVVLAAGMFVLGTGEFAVVGMAVPISASLGVDTGVLGLLNSAFAAAMVIGAPAAAFIARRWGGRASLVGAAVLYAIVTIAAAMTSSLTVLFVVRSIAGLATALFSVTALASVAASVPEQQRARAVAVLLSGLTASNIIGVPVASYLSVTAGWRIVFLALGIASAVVAVPTWRFVVAKRSSGATHPATVPGRHLLRTQSILLMLTVSILFQASVFGVFSYVTVLLSEVTRADGQTTAAVLLVYGIGTTIGLIAGGWMSDRAPWKTLIIGVGGAAACMVAVALTLPTAWVYAALVLQGTIVFIAAAPINERIITMMPGAAELAAGANTTALNIGNALGPVVIGYSIVAGFPLRWVPLLGAAGLLAAAIVGLASQRASAHTRR